MAEPMLIQSLSHIIANGTESERQLAQLCRRLIILTGNNPKVKEYLDMEAVRVLEEGDRASEHR